MAEIIPYIISKIPFSLAFPDFGSMALSPQQLNPLCVVRRLGRGRKESARGTMGRGKKGRKAPAPAFLPLPIAHRALTIFHLSNGTSFQSLPK